MKQNPKLLAILLKVLLFTTLGYSNLSLAESKENAQQQNQKSNHGDYVRKHFLQLMKKPFDKGELAKNKTKILIIGDSHAQDFLNALVENDLLDHTQIRTRYIPTRCQIYLGSDANRTWQESDLELCNKSDNLQAIQSQITDADVITLASMWRKWAVEKLPQTLKNITLTEEQTLFVIGRRSFLTANKKDIQGLTNQELKTVRKDVDVHQQEINELMKRTLNKEMFINVHEIICGESSSCPAYTDNLKMISLDGGHLSKDGARYIGKTLLEKSQLSILKTE